MAIFVAAERVEESDEGKGRALMGAIRQGAVLLTAIAVLVAAVPAAATEVTRASYTEVVEPICKVNTEANEKILKGARAEVKAGKLAPAAQKFAKAAVALKKTYAQLAAVPKPPADTAKLTKWLGYVKTEAAYFAAAAQKLKAGNKTAAEAEVVRLTHTATLANNQALGFEFEYCRFEPSRFT
jgi:hypothetical protein